jgi:hypothetical protein
VGRRKRPDKETAAGPDESTPPGNAPAGSAEEIEEWLLHKPLDEDTAPGEPAEAPSDPPKDMTWAESPGESDTRWFQKEEDAPTDPTADEPKQASESSTEPEWLDSADTATGAAAASDASSIPIDDLLVDLDGASLGVPSEPVMVTDEPSSATQDPMAGTRMSRLMISLGVGLGIALVMVMVAGVPWDKLTRSDSSAQIELAELEALTNQPSDPRLRGIEVRENLRGKPEDLTLDENLLPDVTLEPVFSGALELGVEDFGGGAGSSRAGVRGSSGAPLAVKVHRGSDANFLEGAKVTQANQRPSFQDDDLQEEVGPTEGGLLRISSNRPVVLYINEEAVGKVGAFEKVVAPGDYTIRAMIPEQPDSEETQRVVVERIGQIRAVHFTF